MPTDGVEPSCANVGRVGYRIYVRSS
jgi:hypothetical protein